MSRSLRTAAAILLAVVMQGCYHYHVVAPNRDPATEYESRTMHSLFWGLVQSQDAKATDCASNALDEVKVSTNLGYSLISIATLGIWMPMQVEWRCAKSPSPDSTSFR